MPPRVAPPPPADPSTDPSNPFYVHPSDGPSSVKVTPLLDGSNYHSWARSMRRALGAKLKFEFIDGSIPMPVDAFDPSFRAWNRCNMMIHSWLLNSVEPSIARSIVFMDNASDVWLDLKERFSQGDLVRVSELQQEIYALTQGTRSVTTFYSDLKTLWEELEIYMPIPNCTCHHRCSCAAMRLARNHHQMLHVMRFLTGLNDDFNPVKSQILLLDPLPSITKIFSMILQFERQNCTVNADDSKILVNASASKFRSNGNNRLETSFSGNGNNRSETSSGTKRFCTYCHKTNHFVENCFKKNGVPPHMMKQYSGSAHHSAVEGGELVESSTAFNDTKGAMIPSLTREQYDRITSYNVEQYDKLLHLLQSSSINHASMPAVSNQVSSFQSAGPSSADTRGASHHICASLNWFHSYSEINPMEQKSLKMIGLAERKNGLYYLVQANKDCSSSNHSFSKPFISANNALLPDNALWHFRVPTPLLHNKSPYDLLFQTNPNLHEFKVFGSLVFASTLQSHRTKLDPRARKCIFLGYKSGVKGVVLYDILNKTIFLSRNVTHHEHIFPDQSSTPKVPWTYHTDSLSSPNPYINTPLSNSHDPTPPIDGDISLDNNRHQSLSPPHSSVLTSPSPTYNDISPSSTTSTLPTDNSNTNTRPIRQRRAPLHLSDYVCNNSFSTSNEPIISGNTSKYPLSSFHSLTQLSPSHKAYSMSITHCTEPQSYEEASKHENWLIAMKTELDALAKNCTWTLVELPPHIKPIGCRWVYKVKHKADGTIERYKARLVAKGYNQVEGIDYFETFSPVAKLTTVRTLLAIAAIKNWHLHQLDVNNAFLHGDLQEDVYMKVPDGVQCDKPNLVCKLQKSLYGLKQASRKWYEKLTALLIIEGYTQAASDYSLFTLAKGDDFTALLVYVDDIILAGNSISEFDRIKAVLDAAFKIKNLGQLKYFLGLEVAHSKSGITISQRKYCLDMLKDSGLLGSKPAMTPMDTSIKLHSNAGIPYDDVSSYRRMVGKLLYLNTTRPDIAFATQQLSQFMHAPTTTHFTAACRVLRYLKNNPGQGVLFSRDSELQLIGYSDADWAGCMDTRRSITGYCFFIGKSLVSWRAKKQVTVSRSSSEAEYRALSSATYLRVKLQKTPTLYCDNQSAVHIASNPVFHERTKHLDIDCHLVREKVMQGILKLLPVSTHDQMADFLTKALAPPKFHAFVSKLNMINIYQVKLEEGC
ncbi:hypothetical protein TSUD_192210 [Trifolium subterraneum]|uniref:Reverse transcriptase Ty1/copia-type domain-containing protein n=1 Tax=Trifolium subterraneum TaxID=3900 RepID=A0A2Z6PJT8_TRISU|nr:hypothetical protein TSUD_192210 [Trifolium subterraneum]